MSIRLHIALGVPASTTRVRVIATLVTLGFALGGCDSPVQQGAGGRPGGARGGSSNPATQPANAANNATPAANNAAGGGSGAATGANAANADGGAASRPPPLTINDSDFTESPQTRDPFRTFAREFIPVGPQVQIVENDIRLREFALDDLHVVAVIVGTDNPYAMVVDPTGRGTVIRRADYVGRPETISSGPEGSIPHQVPWRVARIVGSRVRRGADNNLTEIPGEVVFEREDRLNPTAGRAERSLTLGPAVPDSATPTTGAPQPSVPGGGANPFLPFLPPGVGNAPPGSVGSTGGPPGQPPGVVSQRQVGGTLVQSYTTVVPPQQAPPPSQQTLVIQTGPQGDTRVTTQTGPGTPNVPTPQRPPDPYRPPPGATNGPPPIVVTGDPTGGRGSLPTSGLGGN